MPYGMKYWGNNNFVIDEGSVRLNHKSSPSLLNIVQGIRDEGHRGPLLLRFPHLIGKQIDTIYGEFNRAIKEFQYKGDFKAVFPLKVNQFPGFVHHLLKCGQPYGYGLEAGSKAELILAMAYNHLGHPITVNGFKDYEMISLGFIAKKMGHDITLTIEGINELETIIDLQKNDPDYVPSIGIRIRLHNTGASSWSKSGGINAKFGLNSTELIEAVDLLKEANLLSHLTMIHFHIGSQMSDITPLKKALREAGNIYAELRKMGAKQLNAINIGGGLAVEYAQHKEVLNKNYSLAEFANDIVYNIKTIAADKKVKEPDIYTESGRFIAASHAVLIAPVLELFSEEYSPKSLRLKENGNPPLLEELHDLFKTINAKNAVEYIHDALDHLESLLTLFDLGYIDLEDRSNAEILVHLIIKKSLSFKNTNIPERRDLLEQIQERYLVNFSMFQSLPDFWGLGQDFPIMPITKLDEQPTRAATIWDITCDSDGEIPFNQGTPLFLHDIDLESEEYFIALFLVGAYQEVLGMNHNLFSHPTEATIVIDDNGFVIEDLIQSKNIFDILDDIDYDINDMQNRLKNNIENAPALDDEAKKQVLGELYIYLSENGYLKTTR